LKANKEQGVVYVFHASNRQVEKYYTPTKSGLLKTYGFESNRIIFNSEKGTVFYFDINNRQFVDEKGNALITLIPTPEATKTQLPAYPAP